MPYGALVGAAVIFAFVAFVARQLALDPGTPGAVGTVSIPDR